ncbi:ester cyclase [Kibdelosporangium aridum]|uniref:ester cyclase n=1 Tax=Kibdelosporangium aridum TaxID=2030 RepID=UPI000527E7D3
MSFDRIVTAWAKIWNGDLSLIDSVIHPGFTSHAAPLAGGGPAADLVGRQNLHTWVSGIHAMISELRFGIHVGPFVDDPFVVIRWHAEGTYEGRRIEFYGTDILKIADEVITEYWANADSLWFAQQIGMKEVPALT